MRVEKCTAGSAWYASVQLADDEWPSIDENDEWLQRSIRQWVNEHCQSPHFFTFAGTILVSSESDLVNFLLVWS